MNITDIQSAIEGVREKKGLTRATLGRRIGKDANTIWKRVVGQSNLSVDLAIEMLTAMDYEIVIQPSGTRKSDDQIVIQRKN